MSLERLLRPHNIAVIGGRPAEQVIRQNDRLGFRGEIWPVHPTRRQISGRPAYQNLDDLPAAPDAAFVAVNRHATIGLVAELAAAGAGGAVCYASGFAETGPEGAALQTRLCAAAGDMPLLGPNCYGLLNYVDGVALWPDQHGGQRAARGVAIVTQSGNIGLNITMQRRGLPIAYLITLGNQATTGLSDILSHLSNDRSVSAVGLHIEGLDDPAGFADAVEGARRHGKRVIALKTGSSDAGAALAVSHTASMVGADEVFDAFLRRAGVARVRSIPELLEALKILHVCGKLKNPEIAVMSCSGGEAALVADRAANRALTLRGFTPEQQATVAATVSPLVAITNPLDYHTFDWGNRLRLADTFAAVMGADFAMTALVLDFPVAGDEDRDWETAALALADAKARIDRPACVIATLPECMPLFRARALIEWGIVPLCGLEEALAALEAAAAPHFPDRPALTGGIPTGSPRTHDEWTSKQILAASGVPIPQGRRCESAAAFAPKYPAVVKALGIAHKTDVVAVRLNLRDAAAVSGAAIALTPLAKELLVEEMVTDAVAEIIVGIGRDPVVGPFLMLGSGGVLAELAGDRIVLMMPAAERDIVAAIGRLKVAKQLAGYRGSRPGNVSAAVAAILGIQQAAALIIDTLLELDVNPLLVTPTRAVAVDALIRTAEPEHD